MSLDDFKVLVDIKFDKPMKGISTFSGDTVTIVGEQVVENHDGKKLEWYVYNLDHYKAKNGRPFVSLKSNIHVTDYNV